MASAMKRGDPFGNRGSAAKKRHYNNRSDRDGDVLMDARPRDQNRIGKNKPRGGSGRGPSTRGNHNAAALERGVMRSVAAGEVIPKAPRPPPVGKKEIRISNLENNKASSDSDDKGVSSLIDFIQKRATNTMIKRGNRRITTNNPVRIKKYTVESDDAVVISVPSDEGAQILRMNGYQWAGKTLAIKEVGGRRSSSPTQQESAQTTQLRAALQSMLSRRYDPESKLLNLTNLGQDPDLNALGLFDMAVTQSKLFPALMKTCDDVFKTREEKREKFLSVTLANNELTSVAPVTTLAATFPDLKNLDLSNNKLNDLASLESWKRKFRHLDHLILSGNPIEQSIPDFNVEITKWYPSLRFLNNIQVRSDEEAARSGRGSKNPPPPVKGSTVNDPSGIAQTFVTNFVAGFDGDRNAILNTYYDGDSKFSFAVNSVSMRDPASTEAFTKAEWADYIKRSRNLKAITTLPARMSRIFTGVDQVRSAFETIPPTKHADLITEPQKWAIDCVPIQPVPDPTGQYPQGVSGLLVTLHGEYHEIDVSTGQSKKQRSFDRVFTLGPGGPTGVRVLNDALTLRAYGGFAMYQPEPEPTMDPQQAMLIAELSRVTGMNETYSKMCLENGNWDPQTALGLFEQAKPTLPAEAFVAAPPI
ncbi:uncharacterized protein K452DRAFT_72949 [Aplosporella prunicola CBS 121167]|uniref:mRNA export factor MEX67 n=1 Tax=Aplosporella prunicola CBS 121167 TaxID=1176127 RepID=A0A6A6BS66_9PEZI|nr:uncharacterized protein K452DRAFT_72949 [Aplosporella prunicola CBS 121167]KAF2146939.1 hypothetical protein K452DRAFT_72949 [Aplosporella prunicola CBS 121167]